MKNLSIILITGLLISSVTACGSKESKLKGEFIQGCMGSGSTKDLCKCAYDSLEDEYSPEQLFNMMTNMAHYETLSAAINKAQRQCLM